MATETIVLGIIALILGIATAYSYSKPKKHKLAEAITASSSNASKKEEIFFHPDSPSNEVLLLKSNFKALNEKLNMAHSRMNDLEAFAKKEIKQLKLIVQELEKQKASSKVWKSKQRK